jgi:hypothetical protein
LLVFKSGMCGSRETSTFDFRIAIMLLLPYLPGRSSNSFHSSRLAVTLSQELFWLGGGGGGEEGQGGEPKINTSRMVSKCFH